jgi:hypothetical protein
MRQRALKIAAPTRTILLRRQKITLAYTQAAYPKQKKLSVASSVFTDGDISLAMRELLQQLHLISLPQWLSRHMQPNPAVKKDTPPKKHGSALLAFALGSERNMRICK